MASNVSPVLLARMPLVYCSPDAVGDDGDLLTTICAMAISNVEVSRHFHSHAVCLGRARPADQTLGKTWTRRRANSPSKNNSPDARSVALHENALFGSGIREALVEGGEFSPAAYRSLQVRCVVAAEAVATDQLGDQIVTLIAVGLER